MKSLRLLAALAMVALLPMLCFSQSREMYTNPEFDGLSKNEKTLAILPFDVTLNLRPKEKEEMSDTDLKDMERKEGLSVQSALQTFFLHRKEKKDFTVSFQDIDQTNLLLKKAGISPDSLSNYTPEQLTKILGVEGVISGTLTSDKPMSEGAAVAVGVLTGFYGHTNSGKCTINIHDGPSGKLMWKYEKSLSRGLGSNINTIINTIMNKASRKFPYEK
jgi:hypothetical protein